MPWIPQHQLKHTMANKAKNVGSETDIFSKSLLTPLGSTFVWIYKPLQALRNLTPHTLPLLMKD